jgi:Tfp pilus assembly protein PilF
VTSAVAAAERAIQMDSTIPESYAALGCGYSLLGQLRRAEESFRRALALDSTVATTWGWYGLPANRLGYSPAAHRRVARARELEPASLIARLWEAQVLDRSTAPISPSRRAADQAGVAMAAPRR